MHEPWFYCPDLHTGEIVLAAAEARHALRSIRLNPGDALTLFDGAGQVARATLLSNRAAKPQPRRTKQLPQAVVQVETIARTPEPSSVLTLIVPGCKGERLDWLVEKTTELGVSRLVFAEFEHSVVHVGAPHLAKLRRTAIEACKQCRRACLPQLELAPALADALASHTPRSLLAAHLDPTAPTLVNWLATQFRALCELAVVIGPEGGLSPSELAGLLAAGGRPVRLAGLVLRVETAAVAVAGQWAGAKLGLRAESGA